MVTQTASRLILTLAAVALVSGCAGQPRDPAYFVPLSSLASNTGMVIGTLTIDAGKVRAPDQPALNLSVQLKNITPGAEPIRIHDYSLNASVDLGRGSGLFSGRLPAGNYRVIAIQASDRRASGLLDDDSLSISELSFEVVAGAVIDVGELSLGPADRVAMRPARIWVGASH